MRKEVSQILILPLWLEIQILYGLALTMGLGKLIEKQKRRADGFRIFFYNHPVNDLFLNDYGVWIASRTGIYLYDKNNPQIMNALSIGDSY